VLDRSPIYASIPAHDIGRAREWYSDKLGLDPMMEMDGTLLYATGTTMFSIYETPSAGTGKHTIATWVVDDIDAVMAHLRSRGVVFEDYGLGDAGPNTENGIQRNPAGGGAAWFTDSEGNVIGLAELPPDLLTSGAG
jgi:catechol 2,3-dioxygenase-like lactoylglutathione lyase family enzyme